jgi:hypothetical protein
MCSGEDGESHYNRQSILSAQKPLEEQLQGEITALRHTTSPALHPRLLKGVFQISQPISTPVGTAVSRRAQKMAILPTTCAVSFPSPQGR